MLLATELANQCVDSEPLPEEYDQVYGYKCPKCGAKRISLLKDIGEWLDCDLRNPDDEFFRCHVCENCVHITKTPLRILGSEDREWYSLASDGTFLYLLKEGKTWRI